jgi:hypothetical protein
MGMMPRFKNQRIIEAQIGLELNRYRTASDPDGKIAAIRELSSAFERLYAQRVRRLARSQSRAEWRVAAPASVRVH